MKKIFIIVLICAVTSFTATAQNYRDSRYYDPGKGRLNYSHGKNKDGYIKTGDIYYGLRIGPSFSTVNSDDKTLDGGDSQTGLNLGVFAGLPLSESVPLYIETGLMYNEKGGKKNVDGKKMTYDLNYLEVPVVAKYLYSIDDHLSVQPFFGGYLACGVGGKIKNYGEREAQSSFSEDAFKRFDGGLRVGCGLAYDLFYFDISYDIGLTNICHDTFDTSHNGCLALSFGVNF